MAGNASARAGGIPALGRWQDLILPIGIIASVLVILVPLPTAADGRAAGVEHHAWR